MHSIAQLTNYHNKKLDSRLPTLSVAYVDFRKAFDCVQHPTLLNKLAQLGLGKAVVGWMESYLLNRQQKVFGIWYLFPITGHYTRCPPGISVGATILHHLC